MNLSKSQLEQLSKEMTAASGPAESAKIANAYGIDLSAEGMEDILGKVSAGVRELSDDALETINGGIEINNVPNYDEIKQYYREKGANLAFIMCIYFIPSPSCYDIVKIIEQEIEEEDRRNGRNQGASIDGGSPIPGPEGYR